MKLHTFATAPNPRRVHVFLAEKGIDVPLEHVDIMKRANKAPDYLANVDATGRVPVLELDDGSHIAESIAICRYFEALHPEPPLFGRTPTEQGRIEMWVRRMELDFMMPVGLAWVHGSPLTAAVMKEQIPAVAEQSRERVRRFYTFLDRELADREFVAGEFSMADIVGLCTLEFASGLNQLPTEPGQRNLNAWFERVSGRPSAAENRPPSRLG
ncbi:MAG: glutathione S-transferase family protein [Deltaproteobacteria bacterium]|nr:glutathione S-transferase family protein [Deltaproteobacteria bacterium]MBW2447468.1 glutathione S-transferase family protein [Deltaproteobacteria bacterium]